VGHPGGGGSGPHPRGRGGRAAAYAAGLPLPGLVHGRGAAASARSAPRRTRQSVRSEARRHHGMTPKFRVEYLMEAALLGIFMISACAFVVLLDYPTSPVRLAIPNADLRRLLIGLAM